MRLSRRLLQLLVAACLAGVAGRITFVRAAPATTRPAAPALQEWVDANGKAQHPFADLKSAPAVVFLFVTTDCPISNSYAPEINRICKQYGEDAERKIRFYLVQTDPDLSAADAKKHADDFGYTCPVLTDTQRLLVKRLGPKVTPEAVVVGPGEKVLYRGRIDDKWVGYGRSRTEPKVRDLRAALDAILAGKPVPTPETEAVGCPIE